MHPFRPTFPPLRKQQTSPPLEYRAREHDTPELHNWSPPRGVVPYSCFFRSAYSLASSRSEHRQAHTIHPIHFPSTTEVTTGIVYMRAEEYSLHCQSTITAHVEPTPTRDADVVARSTATVRFESVTESATSRLRGDSTYALDELFTASTCAPWTYERATGPGPATATYEPATAHAGGMVTESTESQNPTGDPGGQHGAQTSVAAERQGLETMIQERVAWHARIVLVEDASRGGTADSDAHVTVRSQVHRGCSLTLREFWNGVASTARTHEGATLSESITVTMRPGTNASTDDSSIHEQSGGMRGGVAAGSGRQHAMNRRSSWEVYTGNASSMTQVPTEASGSSPCPLDDLFLEISRLRARTFERVDEPAGDRLARIKATRTSDAISSDTSVSPTNSEQTTHPHNRSEGVAAANRGRDERSARRASLHQFSLCERVVTEDTRATLGLGACRAKVNFRMLERSGYESRSERSTGRSWSPASNRAREQGIQRLEATSNISIEYKDMREREGQGREAGRRRHWPRCRPRLRRTRSTTVSTKRTTTARR
ncbi:uncharacterized protein B0H18DRAFT_74045 [Fomitopsis serialis]|uniref:uncharacterized protein n=1 Tax=Fomitopsis serialis TaxID=139415 RepID=UPI002008C04F|nr:uncharacterized protein B0H18DRAFT_74045 [Neoantrodia serialis]KAH9916333.1 hypothetical protein B0H18DRAFT_74045 [Neoantrodia serialis]